MSVYLDANASEPVRVKALDAALEVMKLGGNPSSVHSVGRTAFGVLERARKVISDICGYDTDDCIFTSGASEANALALHRLNKAKMPYSLYCIGSTDHPSLANFIKSPDSICPGAKVYSVSVDRRGQYSLDGLSQAIQHLRETSSDSSILVSLSVANSETGILSDIASLLDFVKEKKVDLHLDATQALGRGWVPPKDLPLFASLSISGHKIGGIPGAGALLLPHGTVVNPVIPGNGQELGRRKGTQPLAAISSMATALTESRKQDWIKVEKLRDKLQAQLEEVGGVVVGKDVQRLPNTISIAHPGLSAQLQLMKFDMKGFAVSTGSACSSGKTDKSHVLEAMGLHELSGNVIRISLPWNVEEKELDKFAESYKEVLGK